MNWFLAKIIYRIIVGDKESPAQFEEQLRLIFAEDQAGAIAKATALGIKEAFSFFNDKQHLVAWNFIAVSEVVGINEWTDGAEVTSIIHEVLHPASYLSLVQDKAARLPEAATL
jgi:hypothetical protein